jgi:hypothetical protein
MAKSERGPISLNLRNDKLEKSSKKDEGLYLRKDDANLESLSTEELKKMAAGIEARLKAINKSIAEIDGKEKISETPEFKKKEPKTVLPFVRPAEKEKKLSLKDEIRLAKLYREKQDLEKILKAKKEKHLDTRGIENLINVASQDIYTIEAGITPETADDFLADEK